MKAFLSSILAVIGSATLLAQTPPPTAALAPHSSDLGYIYSLPSEWEVVATPSTLADVKQQQSQNATSEDEKKGVACVQLSLTARHGDPASVVVVMELPFACFGQTMSDKDLPGFAQGASEGIKQSFDVSDPVYGSYTLGSHSMWAERAKGTPKGHPELPYTVEIACSLLKKGAVCWMAMEADDASRQIFEQSPVALEGEAPAALVPPSAFDKKPAS
ncbi:MAG TPA: hypothetical protein VK716_10885 [Terracidiphilus sp.]|jgi:hypothetical protein|nr:hypothetical protein [Terracidiphilus sp.]